MADEKDNIQEASNELEEMSARLLDDNNKRLTAMMNRAYEQLVEHKDRASIPEQVFVQYFLPYFRNPDAEENKESVILNKWLELSGGPYNEVNIINPKGEVLYEVPPIYHNDTVDLNILKENNVDLNYVGKAYDNMAVRYPEMGNNIINEGLGSLPKFIHNINNNLELKDKWKKIFKRYDEPEDAQAQDGKDVIKQPVKEDLGLNYDDDSYEDDDDNLL